MNVWHLYTINSHKLLEKKDNTKMFQFCHGLFTIKLYNMEYKFKGY